MSLQFPISEELLERSCKHSAALFLVEPKVGFEPSTRYKNGTITFVKMKGVIYGVTCRHVVEASQMEG